MKVRKNRKYSEYLERLEDREQLLDSLLHFWMEVDSVEDATKWVEKFYDLAKEAYSLVDEISGVERNNCTALYSVTELCELACKAMVHLTAMQEMIPDWQQSSDFQYKKRKELPEG